MLKNETNNNASGRLLTVTYRPSTNVIKVETFDASAGWVLRGTDLTAVTFAAGDVLGARVLSTGSVEVYRNTTLLGTRDASAWSSINQTGYIGLRVNNGPALLLDDFGGGTVSGVAPTLTPTPIVTRTNTPVPTTSTPTNTAVAPTNTPVPPTTTLTPTPTEEGSCYPGPGPDLPSANPSLPFKLVLPAILFCPE